ncbi:MAG: hypothetical protein HQK50_00175 [Oligoflexia bacterium]|nr:hypothetical protein [Oligoflexia bacterium]
MKKFKDREQIYLGKIRERTKELQCMYEVARIITSSQRLPEIFSEVANAVPMGWQYPKKCCCRIFVDQQSYHSANFKESSNRLQSNILVKTERRGWIEMHAPAKISFLKEEQDLLDGISRTLSSVISSDYEKKYLNAQLLHADRLSTIGQLAAGVTHELSEPLANILGFSQLLLKNPELTPSIHADLKKIEKASLYARDIIRKLMTFARSNPGQMNAVSLNDVVHEALFLFESRCAKENITLCLQLAHESELPLIVANSGQIKQVLINLVVNAIQAMPNGGTLIISTNNATTTSATFVSLVVKDSGTGMSKEVLDKIFLPFFTTKDVTEGTGLGLAVVYGIINSHKGKIKVESSVGVGTIFEILFPLQSKR